MVGASEVKVATVEVEPQDNTATLPIGGHRSEVAPMDKQAIANRDMEMRGVQPKPAKRYLSNCRQPTKPKRLTPNQQGNHNLR